MEQTQTTIETALQQFVVMRSVLVDLQERLEKSRHLTLCFSEAEANFKEGEERGLENGIELLEDALTKHFS